MARFLDSPEALEEFKKYNRNIRVRVLIDMFDYTEEANNQEEIVDYMVWVEDDIASINIDRDIEGFEGSSIRDTSTVELHDTDRDYSPKNHNSEFYIGDFQYVDPMKMAIIQVKGENTDWFTYHVGLLTEILPSRGSGIVTLTIDDLLLVLTQKNCEDNLYIDYNMSTDEYQPIVSSRLVKEWLEEVEMLDYDATSIDETLTKKIIYNFNGMTYFEAIKMILELNNAYMFTRNGIVTIKSKLEMAKQSEEPTTVFTDKEFTDGGTTYQENLFEIEEIFSRDMLYNEIKIDSSPLDQLTAREVVWVGGEEESEITENYVGSDITNRELQLKYSPLDEDGVVEDEPTQNVPIVPSSLTVEFGQTFYQDGGMISVDTDTGLITFDSEADLPTNDQTVIVNYTFKFNELLPGKTREFYAHLEYPCTKISDISDSLVAMDVDLDTEIPETDTITENFGDISITSGGNFSETRTVNVPENAISARIHLNGRIYSSKKYGIGWFGVGRRPADWSLTVTAKVDDGSVVSQTIFNDSDESNDNTRADTTIDIPPGSSTVTLEFDGYIENGRKGEYYTPHPYTGTPTSANFNTRIMIDQDTSVEGVIADYEPDDDLETVWVKIENTTNSHVKLHSNVYGQEQEALAIVGSPIKKEREYHPIKEDISSKNKYKITEQLSINNDLFRNEADIRELADFLLYQYAIPRSELTISTVGYPELELLDKVYVYEEKRDVDNKFIITSIKDVFRNGTWEQEVILREFDDSWSPTRLGRTPVVTPSEDNRNKVFEPKIVTNVNAYIEEVMTSADGTYNARLFSEWDNPDNLFHESVEVFIRRDNGEWKQLGNTIQESFDINLVPANKYDLALISVNRTGEKLSFTEGYIEESLNVINKAAPEPMVFNEEDLEWGKDYIKLVWQPNSEKDFDEYEIRLDTNFGAESGG